MSVDLVTRARTRLQQLTQESDHNRSGVPSLAHAQRVVFEALVGSPRPDLQQEIEQTPEWRQLLDNSPIHPEQFEALIARCAERMEP